MKTKEKLKMFLYLYDFVQGWGEFHQNYIIVQGHLV